MVQERRKLYPEEVMGAHIHSAELHLENLPGFRASLARGPHSDGRVTYDDPFAKLRRDFPSETTFPPYTCHDAELLAA